MTSNLSEHAVETELAALYAKRPQIIKPGLERIRAALAYFPGLGLHAPTVIVGGTNGKGTTAGFLAQLYSAAGRKAGLFTSPHLEHFSERFWVTGETVTDRDLVAALQRLREKLPSALYDEISFFEVNTLLAMQVFAELKTEVNVLEVGLGGRWDSTNIFEPVLSVITSIGMDHMEFLGNSIAAIAAEKAGIMRSGRICLWAGADHKEADDVMISEARERGADLLRSGTSFGLTSEGRFFVLVNGERCETALPPEFQRMPSYLRHNFVTALAAFCLTGHPESPGTVADAVLSGRLPCPPSLRGRFQMLSLAEPVGGFSEVLLDACHNPHGAGAFANALSEYCQRQGLKRPPAVVSILKDKDHGAILDILRRVCAPVVLFSNRSERSWSKADVAPRHQDLAFCGDFYEAAQLAGSAAGRSGQEPLVVCGSVHLIGEVLTALRGRLRQPE